MAISYYSGKPGAGKSYFTVERVIVPALKAGRTVVTNIPMTEEAQALDGELIQFSRGKTDMEAIADMLLGAIDDTTGEYAPNDELAGAVFVLDEFSMLMPSGLKQNLIPDKIKAFFSMHRHISGGGYSTEIVIVSQSSSQINIYVKELIDQSYRIEKTMIGKKAVINLSIYSGCVGYRGGADKAILLKKETTKYDPENFKYYSSQTMGDASGQGLEVRTDDATNIFKSPAFKMMVGALLLFPIMIWLGIGSFMSIFSGGNPEPEPVTVVAPSAPRPSLGVATSPVDTVEAIADITVSEEESEKLYQPPIPVVEHGWGEGLKLWYVGSIQYTGQPADHILMVQTWQNNPERVYASDLAELGLVVEEKRGGFMVAYLDGQPYMLPRYPKKRAESKAFFSGRQR